MRQIAAVYAGSVATAVFVSLLSLFLLVFLRIALRRRSLAVVAYIALMLAFFGLANQSDWVVVISFAIRLGVVVVLLTRFGLLALMLMNLAGILHTMMLTTDTSLWYAGRTWFAVMVCIALAVYGFRVSLAGRPVVSGELLGGGSG